MSDFCTRWATRWLRLRVSRTCNLAIDPLIPVKIGVGASSMHTTPLLRNDYR